MAKFMLDESVAVVITWSVLALCAGVAGVAVPFVFKKMKQETDGQDFWYSARDTQNWLSLGLSFFASSMGAWVLFAAPEVGVLSAWWGVIGYACASTLPFLLLCVLGPRIRDRFSEGFCVSDWVRDRYGRSMQLLVALVSLFYMWVYLVAELTSMGNLVRDFAGMDPLHTLLPVSIITMLYTMAGGLPASIWTDRLQGVVMVITILVAIIACMSNLHIGENAWKETSEWSDKGFEAGTTLVFAILGAELFNMGTWQRVYAAKDARHLCKGLAFGAIMIFVTMMLFGIIGMLAAAQDRSRATSTMVIPALAFFDILRAQSDFIIALAFALGTCMVTSSVDSLQTGLLSVISKDIIGLQLSPMKLTLLGQFFVLTVNVPAIIFAHEATKDIELSINVINLFLIADLLTLGIAVPVFAGLGTMATQYGALAGCMSGFITIMGYGWFEFGTFKAGLEMFTLMAFGNIKPPEFGLTASRTCILFFVLPIITGFVTYAVSWGERVLGYLAIVANKKTDYDTKEELVDDAGSEHLTI